MKNPPPYAITSVDNALRLASMLQLEGPMRVADAAERLGVARSTAHRLLQMLVYRDFAAQREDQRYVAGPMLAHGTTPHSGIAELRAVVLPHLRELAVATGETANLVVLVGTQARFAASVESMQALRVGDREGMAFPAHLTSGGRAILAELPPHERLRVLRQLSMGHPVAGDNSIDPIEGAAIVERIQRLGYAVNDQETERGVTAVGVAIHGPGTEGGAAITVSMPTQRFATVHLPGIVGAMRAAAAGIEASLVEAAQAAEALDAR
ncbi:DNA-binding transcriptional regulator, IclR family [Raineyella antarctica]|uniref:DNA-binding transcriptional regulator, IclR family n=1 Tax=Raineyella antarctica TaxID=1577474 RepID=A0A1G6GDN0_9ACTN|nr:IclR family transcriptional regulator [Raineyella antarctica]SDB80097.1 DNA-binding transcriptional regulator, IclR family [Raineyella antarctica]